MTAHPTFDENQERMMHAQVHLLRDRISAQRTQIEGHRIAGDGLAAENAVLAQELDMLSKSISSLVLVVHALRIDKSDLQAENLRLRAELGIARDIQAEMLK